MIEVYTMNKKKTNVEIDLKRLLMVLARHCWVILLVGLLLAAMGFGYASAFIDAEYAAEVRMYVNNTYGAGTVGFSSSQMSAAQSLASTYMVVLDSYDVLESVGQKAVSDYGASKVYTVGQLRAMISTAAIDETEVFKVLVVSTNRDDAVKIANAVKDVLPEVVNKMVTVEQTDNPGEQKEAPPLVSLQRAEYKGKVGPDEKKYAVVGFLVGVLITAGIIVAGDLMDTSINSEQFLTDVYEDIPLLAVVPDAENPKSGNGYKGYYETHKKTPVQKKGGAK